VLLFKRRFGDFVSEYGPDVEHDGLLRLGVDGGQVVWVLFVPDDAQQRGEVGRLIQDCGVLQRPSNSRNLVASSQIIITKIKFS